MKKLYIKTYGCQMNVYDSARMADLLAPLGYAPVENAERADLVILNTCHIREKATEKVYSELGQLKQLKLRRADEGHPMLVAVAGCVAQAEGAEILHVQRLHRDPDPKRWNGENYREHFGYVDGVSQPAPVPAHRFTASWKSNCETGGAARSPGFQAHCTS